MHKSETFEVISGKINITDPCYSSKYTRYNIFNYPAANGTWVGNIISNPDGRVSEIIVTHTCCSAEYSKLLWKSLPNLLGVDSGQLGIFCSSIYPVTEKTGEYGDESTFYGAACAATCDPNDPERIAGSVMNRGFCSSSGYGDGCYKGYYACDSNGNAIAIKVTFIEDEDENEDSNQWWGDEED